MVATDVSLYSISICFGACRTSSFWFRSGYLLRFFVIFAIGINEVGKGAVAIAVGGGEAQGSRFLERELA
jgi:hypothetical protein